jgi:hypothetical protein
MIRLAVHEDRMDTHAPPVTAMTERLQIATNAHLRSSRRKEDVK